MEIKKYEIFINVIYFCGSPREPGNVEQQTADISIVVANYNNGRYLDTLIGSVLGSTLLPRELIIVDDGSTDQSAEILEAYAGNPMLRTIRFTENRGFAHALNAGISAASGRYIGRVDPDDILLPQRLEWQYRYMEEHPEVDVLGGNVMYFHGETGRDIFPSNFRPHHHDILSAYRQGDHGIQHPTVLVKAPVYKQYQYFQEHFPAEDYDVFARMIRDGYRFANLPQPLNRMRIHAGSVSAGLCFLTIRKTFLLRDQIFGLHSTSWQQKRYYYHILLYRRFLFARNYCTKILCIALSAMIYPRKVMLRLKDRFRA
ncbi:MAG TPA: glycosyltransferase [Bacteroidales bacterium]|nr:glycosyltransferase [Bacteroidales bacterium]HRZ49348.1 glycosyltransferase [Bacteroidales bacterium]